MIARNYRIVMAFGLTLMLAACSKLPQSPLQVPLQTATTKPEPSQPSTINVDLKGGGPVVLTTRTAEFQVGPDGYVRAFLLKDGRRLSLDDPKIGAPADSDFVLVGGKDVHFTLDFQQAQVHEAIGKMGAGQRGRSRSPARALGNGFAARAGARSL